MTAPMFELQGVGVQLARRWVLQRLDLRIAPGEHVALVGSNGSGKSTLLRVLNGLQPVHEGHARLVDGHRQAMLFQRPHMLRLSALHNVALGLWLGGQRWRDARTGAQRALQRVGLQAQATQPARQLSGGQQQRLALARAWARSPDVLLLDEPTASLDPHAKREVEALVAEFAAQGLTVVFASHNLGQVKRLATRVLYMERGRLLVDLPVAQFFDPERLHAASPEAAAFVKGELG